MNEDWRGRVRWGIDGYLYTYNWTVEIDLIVTIQVAPGLQLATVSGSLMAIQWVWLGWCQVVRCCFFFSVGDASNAGECFRWSPDVCLWPSPRAFRSRLSPMVNLVYWRWPRYGLMTLTLGIMTLCWFPTNLLDLCQVHRLMFSYRLFFLACFYFFK